MTKIEWCDETHNIVAGCTKVSPGCDNCYAERMACRLAGLGTCGYTDGVVKGGHWTGKVDLISGAVERLAEKCAHWRKPRRIFVQSMGDLFHDQVPFELVDQVCEVVANNPRHTFIFLTKRPERMRLYMQGCQRGADDIGGEFPWRNLWLGVTAENQEQADARIPVLLDTPAAVRFVSVEPMLGAVDLERLDFPQAEDQDVQLLDSLRGMSRDGEYDHERLDWVICGGETGPGARRMSTGWAKALREQCASAGVPFFFKKLGTWWGKDTMPVPELNVRESPRKES